MPDHGQHCLSPHECGRGHTADRADWALVALACAVCLVGLIVERIVVVPAAALIVAAAASAPLGTDTVVR